MLATKTDQTARMHKIIRYFFFAMHLQYMDPGETKKGGGGELIDQWKNI